MQIIVRAWLFAFATCVTATGVCVGCEGTVSRVGDQEGQIGPSDAGTDGVDDGGQDAQSDGSCMTCACKVVDWQGGCKDACYDNLGWPEPTFCMGGEALDPCTMCLALHCGVTDPAACH